MLRNRLTAAAVGVAAAATLILSAPGASAATGSSSGSSEDLARHFRSLLCWFEYGSNYDGPGPCGPLGH